MVCNNPDKSNLEPKVNKVLNDSFENTNLGVHLANIHNSNVFNKLLDKL